MMARNVEARLFTIVTLTRRPSEKFSKANSSAGRKNQKVLEVRHGIQDHAISGVGQGGRHFTILITLLITKLNNKLDDAIFPVAQSLQQKWLRDYGCW